MNKTKFLQTNGAWGSLGYPRPPCYVRNDGCGMVSIANILIEMQQYAKYTPKTIQPYCKKFADPSCNGTYWSGIPTMMEHYGLTDVKECATMPELWKELAKGNRVAIYLMGSRNGGSKKVHWTSGGHFVCSVGYKLKNNKHYVYVKDSYSNSILRNGWITYEGNMRNDVVKVWVGKLSGTKVTTATTADGKLVVDGIGGEATIKATQKFFGTTQDGVISGQLKKLNTYYPSITAVKYDKKGTGSAVVKALQKWLNLTQDGVIGKGTTAAWQKYLRDNGYLAKDEKIDGLFGVKSMKAWQKFLNDYPSKDKAPQPKKTTATTKKITNKIAVKANELAYTSDTSKANYKGGSPTAAYKKALAKAFPNRKSWGAAPRKGASCDVFVGTVIRAALGLLCPRGLDEQWDYFAKSKDWELVKNPTTKNVKDGDIITYVKKSGGGHICIVCGGKIKEAGYQHYYPKTTKTLKARLKTSDKKWLKVYRYKGKKA